MLVSISIGTEDPKKNKHRFVLKGNSLKIGDSRAKSMTSAARRILASRAALFVRPSPREAKSYTRYGLPSVSQTRAREVSLISKKEPRFFFSWSLTHNVWRLAIISDSLYGVSRSPVDRLTSSARKSRYRNLSIETGRFRYTIYSTVLGVIMIEKEKAQDESKTGEQASSMVNK